MGKVGSVGRAARLAPYVALVVLVAGLTWVAVRADGYQSHDPELHDGGVWVTNTADAYYGRMNKPINQLDSAVPAEIGSTPDVIQDGPGVVAVDEAQAQISTIDPAAVEVVEGETATVPTEARVGLAGGTLAVVDPADGRLWATTVEPDSGIPVVSSVDAQTEPVAVLGEDADLAVSTGGTVVGLSADKDRLGIFHPSGAEVSSAGSNDLEEPVESGSSVTTVGETPVVLDRGSGTLQWGDGVSAEVAPDAVLQQPGPQADAVLVAEGERLVAVDLESGDVEVVADGLAGTPTEPVRLGACVFGAWSGAEGDVVQQCGDDDAVVSRLGSGNGDLVFRVNRGEIVLNDRSNGRVWDLDTDSPVRIDNWEDFRRQTVDSEDAEQQEEDAQGDRRPPEAQDDDFGARPGRLTVLHPLDNDSAPKGQLLSIQSVQARGADLELTRSPDGQTVQIRLPEGTTAPVSFRYTVDSGDEGLSDEAQVTVRPRADTENEAPRLREETDDRWTTAAGGVLYLPVLADWRDYADGDPLSVDSVSVQGGSGAEVRVAGDGRVRLTAPAQRSELEVHYEVGDGYGGTTAGSVPVHVQGPRDTQAVAPRAQPDVVTGEVGKPILVRPLANDHPGSDPADPDAELTLAGKVPDAPGTRIETDLAEGTLTVRADRPRTYLLHYQAAYGNSAFDQGTIRVDVSAPDEDRAPVAMPDQVELAGQAPTLVDVLANDVDPTGGMLTVQGAEADTENQLDVAVVDGRWVRLAAKQGTLAPEPQTVSYTISNGEDSGASGEIQVSLRDGELDPTPVTEVDRVTVRAGASAAVPVLRNDFSPSGAPLELVDDAAGASPGQLTVHPPGDAEATLGAAYVAGESVRYVAPADVDEATSFTVDYEATTGSGEASPGEVEVTVLPATENNPPEPPTLEGRVAAGDEVTVRLPGSGLDPDGDAVTLTSISTPPTLGRVVSHGASSLVYEAFPDSAGTEEFGYTVDDGHGGVSEGSVRIAVAPPATPQPPLAVDDDAEVAPGRTVQVEALANDHVGPGDRVSMELVDPPEGVSLEGETGPIAVRAPQDGSDVEVVYTLSNGVSTTRARVVVRPVEGYDNPPIVPDAFGQDAVRGEGADRVTVDVLEDAVDPDGPDDQLSVTEVKLPGDLPYEQDGGALTLPLGEQPRVVPVRVEDGDDGATTASVYLPAKGDGQPYATGRIDLDPGETRQIALADHVVVPGGGDVQLTLTDRIWPVPQGDLNAEVTDEGSFELTATRGYQGPGAISVEVTTGTGVQDAEGTTSIVTVPVQVGETAPVLRCPGEPIEIAQGQEIDLDVTSLCHTWTADPEAAEDLTYTADWSENGDGLGIIEPRGERITVAADDGAEPGTRGTLRLETDGSDPGELALVVTAEPPPTLAPVTVDDLRAGEERSIDLAPYLTPGVSSPDPQILDVEPLTDLDVDAEPDGSQLRLSAGDRVHGTARFRVTMSDAGPDTEAAGRQAEGLVAVAIRDRPDAPSRPVPGRTVRSQEVVLSWEAPAANGSPVDRYRVTGDHDAGTTVCASTTCTIRGLTNGTDYTFTVEAHNGVGWSEPSARSAVVTPDAKPGAVGPIRVRRVGDGQVTLSWAAPTTRTSAIEEYRITWPGSNEGKSVQRTTATIGGLDNNQTQRFTVRAVNALAPGPPTVSAPVQSIGTPAPPGGLSLKDQRTAGDHGAVTLSWDSVPPNGPGPTTYTVLRQGKPLPQCTRISRTTCDDSGMSYDGTTYKYTVKASNAGVPGVDGGAPRTSRAGAAQQWRAVGRPESWQNWSVDAPRADRKAVLKYTVPDSRGSESTVKVYVDGAVRTTLRDQQGTHTRSYSLGTNNPHRIALQLCNEETCGAVTSSRTIQTVGPLSTSDVKATSKLGPNGGAVGWTITWDSDGAPTRLEVRGQNTSRVFNANSKSKDRTTVKTGMHGIGWNTTEKITIRIVERSGYDRKSVATSRTSKRTSNINNKAFFTRGDQCNDGAGSSAPDCSRPGARLGQCTHRSCGRLSVTVQEFTRPNVTCTFYDETGTLNGHRETFRNNTTSQADAYYGKPGKETWFTCQNADGSGRAITWRKAPWTSEGYGGG